MKKNKKKNHHGSKASRKRREARKANRERRGGHEKKPKKHNDSAGKTGRVRICSPSNENVVGISEGYNLITTDAIGNGKEPGLASLILARHFKSLIEKLESGDGLKAYHMIRFHFSPDTPLEFAENHTLVGRGGVGFTAESVLHDDLEEFCLGTEKSLGDFVAQYNETSEITIRTVAIEALEGDQPFDPSDMSDLKKYGAVIDQVYGGEVGSRMEKLS
jgi:hypothetical protein